VYSPKVSGPSPAAESGPKTYSVGTLTYTLPGLAFLMGWLLWGDFCFTLMEAVFPAVLPVKLKQLEAPSWVIALIVTGIPGLLNATVCPVVSFLSDRHRSPMGRRIPFIVFTIPFLCAFLILLGFAGPIATFLAKHGIVSDARFAALIMCGVFTVGFQFFNMFVASVYYYLFNDVVPHEFLGRFLAAFRVVGTLSSSLFSFFIFPHAETHFTAIFTGAAVLYGVVFYLMCRYVKEGEYPPPPVIVSQSRSHVLDGIKTFFVESFSQRFYWLFYAWVAFSAAGGTIMVFQVFFAQSVGLSLFQLGQFLGTLGIVIAVLLFPCGVLSDWYHPVRTMRIAATVLPFFSILPIVFVLTPVPPEWAFLVWCVAYGATAPVTAIYFASELPTYMHILPKERYGQFSSSNAVVRSLAVMAGGVLGGGFLDVMKTLYPNPDDAYRFIPLWLAGFQVLSAVAFWLLYREWKKRGGRDGYTPPAVY
jgi:maltose/moltooligosaccharide transporter